MISVERTRDIVSKAIDAASGKDVQVMVTGGKEQLARVGCNEVHQNLLRKEYSVRAQVADGKRVGLASLNRFSGEDVTEAVQKAAAIARIQKEDPEFLGLSEEKEEIISSSWYHHPTMDACFDAKLSELENIFHDAKERNVEVAGAFSHGDQVYAVGNSKGMFSWHAATSASFTLSIRTSNGGTGWSEFHSHELEAIQPEKLYDIALQKALLSENPHALGEGEYTVILEPPAVETLFFWLGYMALGGLPIVENRSCFSDKIGQKVMDERISVVDDCSYFQSFGAPFDYDGVRRQACPIIENGVFVGPVSDRVLASKLGRGVSTGHALPYPAKSGPLPLNLRVSGGNSVLSKMIEETRKGILVTRFFYDNVIDPRRLTLTGMTRDGTFMVENGRIVHGLKNLRFNICVPELLNRVFDMSHNTWSLTSFGRMSVPAMRLDGFRFTGSSNS